MDLSIGLNLANAVIKEAHSGGKMTFYRFPSGRGNFAFDPKTEFVLKQQIFKFTQRWKSAHGKHSVNR